MRHHQVAGEVLEHRRACRIDVVKRQEAPIGLRRGLRLELCGDDVEDAVEMRGDGEPRQHCLDVIGRAISQDQLAAFQPRDRFAHHGVRLERRMIDLCT